MNDPIPPASHGNHPPESALGYGQTISGRRTSGTAVASLVLGILGCVPLVTGLLAIAFGLMGIRKTKEPFVSGRGMAIAGLILGIISVLGWAGLGGMLGVGYIESKPASAVARQFLQDLSVGNITAATTNSTGFTPNALQTQAALMSSFGAQSSVNISSFNYSMMNGVTTMTLGGTATYATGTKACSFELVKINGVYKVRSFSVR